MVRLSISVAQGADEPLGVPVPMTKSSIVIYSVDGLKVILVIRDPPDTKPKKSWLDDVEIVCVVPSDRDTDTLPGTTLHETSFKNTCAPTATTPGLKVNVIGVA